MYSQRAPHATLNRVCKRREEPRGWRPMDEQGATGNSAEPLAIVVPTLNEAENVEPLVELLLLYARVPVEILFVDDGSSDGTRARVRALSLTKPVRLIERNSSTLGLAGAHRHRHRCRRHRRRTCRAWRSTGRDGCRPESSAAKHSRPASADYRRSRGHGGGQSVRARSIHARMARLAATDVALRSSFRFPAHARA